MIADAQVLQVYDSSSILLDFVDEGFVKEDCFREIEFSGDPLL